MIPRVPSRVNETSPQWSERCSRVRWCFRQRDRAEPSARTDCSADDRWETGSAEKTRVGSRAGAGAGAAGEAKVHRAAVLRATEQLAGETPVAWAGRRHECAGAAVRSHWTRTTSSPPRRRRSRSLPRWSPSRRRWWRRLDPRRCRMRRREPAPEVSDPTLKHCSTAGRRRPERVSGVAALWR